MCSARKHVADEIVRKVTDVASVPYVILEQVKKGANRRVVVGQGCGSDDDFTVADLEGDLPARFDAPGVAVPLWVA